MQDPVFEFGQILPGETQLQLALMPLLLEPFPLAAEAVHLRFYGNDAAIATIGENL